MSSTSSRTTTSSNVQGAMPAPLNYAPPGYTPYPKSICTSINHQVCHGIPNDRPLKNGDIVNIDVTVIKDGWHGDTSRMFIVGEGSIAAKRLCQMTYEAMWKGIVKVKPGARLGDIGHAIQTFAENNGFSVVREFCGHGIGRRFHEEPQVLHYGRPGTLEELVPGMVFTIEPMINAGRREIRETARDGWTIVTKDRSLSAQWEHTVLVTETGYEVLTLSAGSPPPPAFVARLSAPDARDDRRSVAGPRHRRQSARPRPASASCARASARQARCSSTSATRDRARPAATPAAGTDAASSTQTLPSCGRARRCPQAPPCSRSAATAAASCSRTPTSTCWCCCRTADADAGDDAARADRGLHHRLLGHRPGDRLERAHASTNAWPRRSATSRCRPRCSKSR